ncbi:uncharacterized protein LOC144346448 [Saccoglossus kowalevskii]
MASIPKVASRFFTVLLLFVMVFCLTLYTYGLDNVSSVTRYLPSSIAYNYKDNSNAENKNEILTIDTPTVRTITDGLGDTRMQRKQIIGKMVLRRTEKRLYQIINKLVSPIAQTKKHNYLRIQKVRLLTMWKESLNLTIKSI